MNEILKNTLPNTDCDSEFNNVTLDFSCSIQQNGKIIQKPFKEFILDYSVYIPGLGNTEIPYADCSDMVPQGICITEDYFLISAYCNPGDKSETQHTSVIYVISKSSGAFVKTLVLGIKEHVGGIAYDGTYLWVCSGKNPDSSTVKEYPGTITAYTFSECEALMNTYINSEYVNILPAKKNRFLVGVTASFCTYYDERLWVGDYADSSSESQQRKVIGYHVIKYGTTLLLEDNPSTRITFSTVDKVQGLNFFKFDGDLYIFLTRSSGRNNTKNGYISEILVNKSTSYNDINISDKVFHKKISLPPMIEGIFSYASMTYCIFESAANVYFKGTDGKGTSEYPVNRICKLYEFMLL